MKRLFVALLLTSVGSVPAWADNTCPAPTSYKDLLACAEARSPDLQRANLELDIATAQTRSAGQWQNPELSAETFQGTINNDNRKETDISLAIPIEFGKVSARKSAAQGRTALAEAKLYEARAKIRSEVFLKLHRLRQVLHEEQIADEAIHTFTMLLGQYSKRPGLSPEQQISAYVYQLSKSEYEIKKTDLSDEVLALNSFFKIHLGMTHTQIKSLLPQSPTSWPQVAPAKDVKPSIQQRIAQAELQSAQADLSLARAETWPALALGPSIKMLDEGGQSNSLMGVNLSLSLPVFNWNGGARAAASSAVKLSESKKQLSAIEQDLRREELMQIYQTSVKVLEQSLSHEAIEKKHEDAERLFKRGVVPSSLVIEAHRTSFELEKVRHERELKALEALLNLYTLDGTIMEASL